MRTFWSAALLATAVCATANKELPPSMAGNTFVHLFSWSWNDVAIECENHLGPAGFKAVQVSPPQMHITGSQWWTVYQPLSYKLEGRQGNRAQFTSMVERCAEVGVDIYVDAVINHMAAENRDFPDVPYTAKDFNTPCPAPMDIMNRTSAQFCDLLGLNDLKTGSEYVRDMIASYLNDLLSIGVNGFRFDAAKHIPVADIEAILSRLDRQVIVFHEVTRTESGEPILPGEYEAVGSVTEFGVSTQIGNAFLKHEPLSSLREMVHADWVSSANAVTFASNHDNQRHPLDTTETLTFFAGEELYALGEVFSLAYGYGYPKVMSSFYFSFRDQGPPSEGANTGGACGLAEKGQWVCEHRWHAVKNMVEFRKVTAPSALDASHTHWWNATEKNQIAFGRGGLGFVAINAEESAVLQHQMDTGMPAGIYCDVVRGEVVTAKKGHSKTVKQCNGPVIRVNSQGKANFVVGAVRASAIHMGSRLPKKCKPLARWPAAFFVSSKGAVVFDWSIEDKKWVTVQELQANAEFSIDAAPKDTGRGVRGRVTEAGTYRILFCDRTKQFYVELTSPMRWQNAFVTGTNNDWSATEMYRNRSTLLWTAQVVFNSADQQFRIGGNAVSFPQEGNYVIDATGPGAHVITFDDQTKEIAVHPYHGWEGAYFRGSPNGWDSTLMETTGNLIWTTRQTFSSSVYMGFKVDHFGDWSDSYPQPDNYDITSPGTYDISFDELTKVITVTKISGPVEWEAAYFRGAPNDWNADLMEKVGQNQWQTTQTFSGSLEYKIDRDGMWGESYPAVGNFAVPSPGEYLITFNDLTKEASVLALSEHVAWEAAYFRGAPNGWGADLMENVGENLWQTTQTFDGSLEFKVDRDGTWAESYPLVGNFAASTAGTYLITFNDLTKEIIVVEQN